MIYLDTAALVKLVRREPESDELAGWLADHSETIGVTSVVSEVEVPRALRRSEPALLRAVPAVLERVALYAIDDLVRATAAAYPDPNLRSLDAIHLATAQAVFGDQLTAFVTYDKRLLTSAAALGLPVAHPGL
ncbi:MAG TPA: type II toxin-antitoxin system VapC family toxin [Mycobacteriales bacterium]|nr:type II toxin-antitoxin system VapC family toxin [Mycobacteriales bacterium]